MKTYTITPNKLSIQFMVENAESSFKTMIEINKVINTPDNHYNGPDYWLINEGKMLPIDNDVIEDMKGIAKKINLIEDVLNDAIDFDYTKVPFYLKVEATMINSNVMSKYTIYHYGEEFCVCVAKAGNSIIYDIIRDINAMTDNINAAKYFIEERLKLVKGIEFEFAQLRY